MPTQTTAKGVPRVPSNTITEVYRKGVSLRAMAQAKEWGGGLGEEVSSNLPIESPTVPAIMFLMTHPQYPTFRPLLLHSLFGPTHDIRLITS